MPIFVAEVLVRRGRLLEPSEKAGVAALAGSLLDEGTSRHTGPQIAARLYISEVTVRNHLHAIYERVGVSGRRELQGRLLRSLLET